MKTLRLNNAAGQGTGLRKGIFCSKIPVFSLFLGLLLFSQNLSAQVTWFDLGGFEVGYELSTTASELYDGDQFDIKLYGDAPLTLLPIGMHFEVELDAGISVDATTPASLPSSSWLGTASELEMEYFQDGNQENVAVYRSDLQLQSGSGWVTTLHCEVEASSVALSAVVQSIGGGIIIVDNVDMQIEQNQFSLIGKNRNLCHLPHSSHEPGQDYSELSETRDVVYPNPCGDWIMVKTSDQSSRNLRVLDSHGNLLKEEVLNPEGRMAMDDLPGGLYFIQVEDQQGAKSQTFRIKKQ